jgi:hypothetical protein
VVGLGVTQTAVATGNTLRIDPAVQTVAQDGTFVAHVVQSADVPVSGASATITFDPTLLQIQSVARAAPYADAAVFAGASPVAIAAANTTGSLVGVAAAFLPPDAVPAGEAAFLDITFKAIGCGTAELGLPTGATDAALLDGREATYGDTLEVSTIAGSVTTCVAATPTPSSSGSVPPSPSGSPSPSASASPSAPATPTPTPRLTPPPLPAGNSIRIEPFYTGVVKDGGFAVRVVQRTVVPSSGTSVTILFDPAIAQVVSVTRSPAFAAAPIFAGATPSAITAANASGKLNQVAAAFLPPGNIPAGEADFITIEFKAIACGSTNLTVPNTSDGATILDGRAGTYGLPLAISTVSGVVEACDPKATPTPKPTPTPTPTPIPTPVPTPFPTEAAVVLPPATPPTTGEAVSPPAEEVPIAEEIPPAAATATPQPVAAVAVARQSSPKPAPVSVGNVAAVGLGMAGVIVGLVIVLTMTTAMAAGLVIPLLVVRGRAGRRRW